MAKLDLDYSGKLKQSLAHLQWVKTLSSRMDAIIQNMFEINYSQLIQYEILEKLVT